MITLYSGGPMFGIPDASPFCMKAEMLLKIAKIPYEHRFGDVRKAPKGKIPWIDDAGTLVPDSTFIQMHLEQKHGADFSGGYSRDVLGAGWALEKFCEDHLYWLIVRSRWMNDVNFDKGPRQFFKDVPAPLRGLVIGMIRGRLRKTLLAQGLGRHSDAEIKMLATRDITALSDFLGEKDYVLGPRVSGADAIVFSTIASLLCGHFETPERPVAESFPNLTAYNARMMREFFPALAG